TLSQIENEQWIKSRSGPINAILKTLTVSIDTLYKFFEDMKIHYRCQRNASNITTIYCVSQDPDSEKYIIVMQYCLLHCDLSSGNILQSIYTHYEFSMERLFLTDFGLSKAINETMKKKSGDVVGVLPYIAPERPNFREVHYYFKKWQMVTLEKGIPSEYFSPIINDYVTFNAEEFEEN
ncbi:15866_t:CDS:2, partial [Gigaspora margarita]